MYSDHEIPLFLAHVGEGAISNDPGVVHEHIEIAETANGEIDQSVRVVPVADIVTARDRASTGPANFLDNFLGGRQGYSTAVECASAIVHHHGGAFGGQL